MFLNNNAKEHNKNIAPNIPKLNLININKNTKIDSDLNHKALEVKINRPAIINNNEKIPEFKNVNARDYFISGVIKGCSKSANKNYIKVNKDKINPGISIKGPKVDSNINSAMNINSSFNINNQNKKDFFCKGVIRGTKSEYFSSGKVDTKGPEFNRSEIKVNNLSLSKIDIKKDVFLKGTILGTKAKNKNLNGPKKK